MKKIFLSILCLAALTACKSGSDKVQEMLDSYADIQVGSDFFEGISDNGREVLNYFKLASAEVDNIYWKQNFGDKKQMTSLADKASKE
ncbi:MAG: hypothetical protein IKH11_07295, partial [Bacteroidales bacterium]|nr:hypothetical protein [Bacteroidales bacterium]